jgi:SRSO17 transposase
MINPMDVPIFLFEQTPVGILDAGDGPVLTQLRVDMEDPMDKAMLDGLTSELKDYIKRFETCFQSTPSREHLTAYVRGQIGPLQRKSVEPMALESGIKPRTLQQFLSVHKWDEGAMRSLVRSIVATEHADPDAVGVIDETSFNKKGKKTVGVQRQWCGHVGKIDNCVQTVHLTYAARDFATIIDSDLYLPQDWAEDNARRVEAGVPENVTFRKKWEIALEMLERAKREGVAMRWLTADEFYGRVSEFLAGVEALGMLYVVEVPVSTCGWTARGHARGQQQQRRVDELFKRGGPSWVDYHVKDSTKGPVIWRVRAIRFVPHAGTDRSEKWLLIAVNPLDDKAKYFLSNAPATIEIESLLTVAFTRWRIEHNFEESKQEIGLDHFEVRTYTGLQRHLAISMVSLLFLVQASLRLRGQTRDHWTVPQTRLIVNTMVDQELSSEQRNRQLDRDLYKIDYWQRRAKVAEECHRRRRLRDLEAAGVNLAQAVRCPLWIDTG